MTGNPHKRRKLTHDLNHCKPRNNFITENHKVLILSEVQILFMFIRITKCLRDCVKVLKQLINKVMMESIAAPRSMLDYKRAVFKQKIINTVIALHVLLHLKIEIYFAHFYYMYI